MSLGCVRLVIRFWGPPFKEGRCYSVVHLVGPLHVGPGRVVLGLKRRASLIICMHWVSNTTHTTHASIAALLGRRSKLAARCTFSSVLLPRRRISDQTILPASSRDHQYKNTCHSPKQNENNLVNLASS